MVGGEGYRLGVEIATRNDLAGRHQHQRVVGDGVGLDEECTGSLCEQVEAGAHHLGLAAQAVGVLHPLVADGVGVADGTSHQQASQRGGGGDLALMRAQRMDFRPERRGRGHGGVNGQRARDQGRAGKPVRIEKACQRVGSGKLGAVDQRKPFLGAKFDGFQFGRRQRLGARHPLAFEHRFALAEHYSGHMSEWREITRCADGTLLGHHRRHALGQQAFDGGDHEWPHA